MLVGKIVKIGTKFVRFIHKISHCNEVLIFLGFFHCHEKYPLDDDWNVRENL